MSSFLDFLKEKLTGSQKKYKNNENPDKYERSIQPDNVLNTDNTADKKLKSSDENTCNKNEEAEFLIKDKTVLAGVKNPDNLTSIVVPDGITEIGPNAFVKCKKLRKVVLPESLKIIRDRAFYFCRELNSVNFPEGLEILGSSCFGACALEEIILPQSIISVENSAFWACTSKKLVIPVSIENISSSAFGCTGNVFISSDKGIAPIFPDEDRNNRTSDIIVFLSLMKKCDFDNIILAKGHRNSSLYDAMCKGMELASSYYIVTEDETALKFILSNMTHLIENIHQNTDLLLEKLIAKGLVDDETLLNFIKIILRAKRPESSPEHRVLKVLLDYFKNERGIGLYEFSQLEVVKYISMISPVPWNKVYFRAEFISGLCRINYCYEEKDTGFITSKSTEKERYGYILSYRRLPDIHKILIDRSHTLYSLYEENNEGNVLKAATFSVESNGKYTIDYEYETPEPENEWEIRYTGGVSTDFSVEYPVQKLREESEAALESLDIPPKSQTVCSFTVSDFYDMFKKCYDYLGKDYIIMNPPATEAQIQKYLKYFDSPPDKDFIEWLHLCNGLTIGNCIIYDINSCEREAMWVESGYEQIANDLCIGYGISCETGECWKFDHDFGNSECSFISVLASFLEQLRDDLYEYENEKEEEYLIKKGRSMSDSYAEFIYKHSGEDGVIKDAEKSRELQIKKQNEHQFNYYYNVEIVKEYKAYIHKVCNDVRVL